MGWLGRQLPPESSRQTIIRLARHMPTRCESRIVDDAGLLPEKGSSGNSEGEPMLCQPAGSLVPQRANGWIGRGWPDVRQHDLVQAIRIRTGDCVLAEFTVELGQLGLAFLPLTGEDLRNKTALRPRAGRLLERGDLGFGLLDPR